MKKNKIIPIHPGEVLSEEFLIPLKISQNQLGKAMNVSPRRINEIINQKRSITADTALRLGRYFNMSAEFWLGLQMEYDLHKAEDQLLDKISKEVSQGHL